MDIKSSEVKNVVDIDGAIARPGTYELGDSLKLSELIDKADGVLGDAYLDRIDIIRIKPDFNESIIKLNLNDILAGQSGKYFCKDKKTYSGKYLFTIDFAHPESNIVDTDHSEVPHEHKCAHILALDDGNYAAQPNNRLIWSIPSFTVKNEIPNWKVQTSDWNVEDSSRWRTEDTDNFFYEIEEKKHD